MLRRGCLLLLPLSTLVLLLLLISTIATVLVLLVQVAGNPTSTNSQYYNVDFSQSPVGRAETVWVAYY